MLSLHTRTHTAAHESSTAVCSQQQPWVCKHRLRPGMPVSTVPYTSGRWASRGCVGRDLPASTIAVSFPRPPRDARSRRLSVASACTPVSIIMRSSTSSRRRMLEISRLSSCNFCDKWAAPQLRITLIWPRSSTPRHVISSRSACEHSIRAHVWVHIDHRMEHTNACKCLCNIRHPSWL